MTDDERKEIRQEMDDLIMLGLVKNLRGDADAPKPAALTAAMSWLDGKGSKGREKEEANEYAAFARQQLAGRRKPDVDLEDYDAATRDEN